MRWLLMLLFISSTWLSQAQTADEIVRQYIRFTGGEKNWKKVTSMVSSGEYDYGGVAFPYTSYSKAPDLYKFVVPFNGKYYAQAFDGKRGWKIDAFKNETTPTLLEGKPALAMANEADVELESPFINYHTKGHQVSLEGKETRGNKTYYKIKLLRKDGSAETFYFDTTTFALDLKVATAKNTELDGALLHTHLSDYRKVGGLNIPFKAVSKSNDQTILTITIKEVKINTPIANTEFQP